MKLRAFIARPFLVAPLLLGSLLTACVTQPPISDVPEAPVSAENDTPVDPFSPPVSASAETAITPMPAPRPVRFEELPRWDEAELTGAVEAFLRSCARWQGRDDADPVSSSISYAGTIGEWRPACATIEVVGDSQSARRVFEALFTPLEVLPGDQTPRFTGYFEPEIEARETPVFP